jgi:probable rRNA maturation factor
LNIRVFYEVVDFRLKGWKKIKKLIEKVIRNEKKVSGDLNFILTNDKRIKEINMEFLKHNFYTDVISFNYSSKIVVNGEVYISVDTVKMNALNYKVSYNLEFVRVIVHGVLHLCGYEDKSKEGKRRIQNLEDYWLKIYKEK